MDNPTSATRAVGTIRTTVGQPAPIQSQTP
jgi:hypothetical protein